MKGQAATLSGFQAFARVIRDGLIEQPVLFRWPPAVPRPEGPLGLPVSRAPSAPWEASAKGRDLMSARQIMAGALLLVIPLTAPAAEAHFAQQGAKLVGTGRPAGHERSPFPAPRRGGKLADGQIRAPAMSGSGVPNGREFEPAGGMAARN